MQRAGNNLPETLGLSALAVIALFPAYHRVYAAALLLLPVGAGCHGAAQVAGAPDLFPGLALLGGMLLRTATRPA